MFTEKKPDSVFVNSSMWREHKPTARGAKEHFEDLDLNIEKLRHKKILDIGSGLNELENELKEENLDIVSLDPFYALTREERDRVYEEGYEDGPEKLKELLDKLESNNKSSQLVAGRSETLPFVDDSFDLVISHYGSPFYAEDAEKIQQFFLELNRVLKSGGEARIYPLHLKNSNIEKSTAFKKALDDLKKNSFTVEESGLCWILKKS